jgi:hypothetical protein
MGRLAVVTRHGGVASSYDWCFCQCAGQYSGTTVAPGTACPVYVTSTDQLYAEAWFAPPCGGSAYYYDITAVMAWSSSNTGVFTLNNTNHKGLLTAMGVGSALAKAQNGPGECGEWDVYGGACICGFYTQATGSASCSVVCAVPVNFTQSGSSANGNGNLVFSYSWGSSTGVLSDLSQCSCKIGEQVYYPNGNPYIWPRPPWSASSTNPTVDISQSATQVPLIDSYRPGTMVAPYGTASFTATQYYAYTCTAVNNGNPVRVAGPISIVRSVTQNSDGTFKYTITKSGASASCLVGVYCAQ